MELEATITVNEEVAKALRNLYNIIENMNWDYDIFADACFAIANHENGFEWGLTKINIKYTGE